VKGDYYNAERFAEVTYGNLRDRKNGIDQDSAEVARGAFTFAKVILLQKGDVVKAEKLARESLRIQSQLHNSDHDDTGDSCNLLAAILMEQGNLGDETKGLYARALAINIKTGGPDGADSAVGNTGMAKFYSTLALKPSPANVKFTHLNLAKSHFEAALPIHVKIYGINHPETVLVKSSLADIVDKIMNVKKGIF
jgi:hypothetical protein